MIFNLSTLIQFGILYFLPTFQAILPNGIGEDSQVETRLGVSSRIPIDAQVIYSSPREEYKNLTYLRDP